MKAKKKKKKVFTWQSGCSANKPLSLQYSQSRLHWIVDLTLEFEDIVEEYEIKSDGRMFLSDILDQAKANIGDFSEGKPTPLTSATIELYRT